MRILVSKKIYRSFNQFWFRRLYLSSTADCGDRRINPVEPKSLPQIRGSLALSVSPEKPLYSSWKQRVSWTAVYLQTTLLICDSDRKVWENLTGLRDLSGLNLNQCQHIRLKCNPIDDLNNRHHSPVRISHNVYHQSPSSVHYSLSQKRENFLRPQLYTLFQESVTHLTHRCRLEWSPANSNLPNFQST